MGRPEDSRVKIPALVHFTRLGYTYMSIKDKERNVDYDGDTNIFYSQFLSAVNRINQTELTLEDAKKIIGELKIKLDNDDLGKSFFKILQSGIDGIKLIDFSDITGTKNDYTVVTELPYENGDDNFRPDIVVLINGIPLSFIEVKRQNNREGILTERSRMERRFSNKIYRRFVGITQFTVFSNNNEYDDSDIEPIQGAFYASSSYKRMFFSKFREQREDELKADMKPIVTETEEFVLSDNNLIAIKGTPEYVSSLSEKSPTNRIITSLYTKERLLFLLKYGICYKTTTNKDGITEIEKHIMRYPQLFATLAIRDKLREGVRKGVIWHTQGSGKTALAYSNVHFLSDYFSKEEGKIAKFYFIVDRLDLAEQAKNEFEARGLKVKLIKDKEEFIADITNPGESNTSGKVTMTVINIQKFSKESVTKPSDYNVDVQRVYFLDEAHRSYNPTGSFLANLMASDRDAVQIALTGTPLIGDGYNTKDVFGNYIHKYYYNQSIADGYTLKLIREEIETTYKNQLNATLDQIVRQGSIAKKNLYAHPKFVEKMVDYIIQDFEEGRTALDSSIGAMIVCDSSEQAREVDRQLKRFSAYTHALVLHDEGTKQDRKNDQEEFKKGNIDILVVYNMLLTGFDAPRLKKQGLGILMTTETIIANTKQMIDDLKTVCANFGLGNASSEYKIITEIFLYKFLNDKFLYEVQQAEESLKDSDNVEQALNNMSEDDYEMLMMLLPPATAKLKKEHFISYLFNHKNDDKFNELFDSTLWDISNTNLDVFSVSTGSGDKIRLFDEHLSQNVTESNRRSDFCKAMIDKLVTFSFADAFSQKYDFFATIFEYLIKDYNKDFGKYAEYYTPHSIASIIARIMVPEGTQNVTVYDPAAGSGTLVLALAHEIGESNCTIYTQDISQKSNEFLRLNLILNNLVHSLGHVVHGDTLLSPQHLNRQKNGLMKFDYIVSNPPFNVDFSDNRDTLAGDIYKERFWAGVPNVPNKKKDSMAIYQMFLQHIIFSMKESGGKAAVVVPTGFLTAGTGIPKKIRERIVKERMLRGVVSMPSNIFATTGTNVSVVFLDNTKKYEQAILMDASKLGTKVKIDGKNQRTVLSPEEIEDIIHTFNNFESKDDFSVVVDYEKIEQKKCSFSAGQYFEVKIEYVELTQEEFKAKMDGYAEKLTELFAEGNALQAEIIEQLKKVKYE